jgi:hypothetical protein
MGDSIPPKFIPEIQPRFALIYVCIHYTYIYMYIFIHMHICKYIFMEIMYFITMKERNLVIVIISQSMCFYRYLFVYINMYLYTRIYIYISFRVYVYLFCKLAIFIPISCHRRIYPSI